MTDTDVCAWCRCTLSPTDPEKIMRKQSKTGELLAWCSVSHYVAWIRKNKGEAK